MAKYKGRDDVTQPWEEAFLRQYVAAGGKMLSAKEAGTTWPQVKKHIEASPRFAALWETAHEEMLETLERKLMRMTHGEKGNFLATIARLKAELPAKYNDKLQVSGAIGHLHSPVPAAEIESLLRAMLADVAPETRAALAPGAVQVLDADGKPVA